MHSVKVKLKNGTSKTFKVHNHASLLFEYGPDGKLVNVYEASPGDGVDADYVEIDIFVGENE